MIKTIAKPYTPKPTGTRLKINRPSGSIAMQLDGKTYGVVVHSFISGKYPVGAYVTRAELDAAFEDWIGEVTIMSE